MFGTIFPEDRKITPYTVSKPFTVSKMNTDTATKNGVMALEALSGSLSGNPGFTTASHDDLGLVNNFVSGGQTFKYYKRPLFETLKHNFFEYATAPNRYSTTNAHPQFVLDRYNSPWGRGTIVSSSNTIPDYQTLQLRKLHNRVNVISIPQNLYGEGVKTGSIELRDYSRGVVTTIVDDGFGNLYDKAYETNYLSGSLTTEKSGSSIGVVNYDHGLVMITDTGSYATVALGTGGTGWILDWSSTKTFYEHEYTVVIPEGKFNSTTNVSVTHGRSGSATIPASIVANVSESRNIIFAPGESSYDTTNGYTATTRTENFATHSAFAPYVTTIGLYNDHGDLLAVAKSSQPIKNDPELALSFIVRFDI